MRMSPPTADYGGSSGPPGKSTNVWVWIVVGGIIVIGCGGALILSVILFPVFNSARSAAVRTVCISNVKRISIGAMQYAADNDDHLPAGEAWQTRLDRYVGQPRVFTCPAVRRQRGGDNGYAVNTEVAGKALKGVKEPPSTIWVFETARLVDNASGDPANEPPPNRHGNGRSEGYLDGHAKFARSAPR